MAPLIIYVMSPEVHFYYYLHLFLFHSEMISSLNIYQFSEVHHWNTQQ